MYRIDILAKRNEDGVITGAFSPMYAAKAVIEAVGGRLMGVSRVWNMHGTPDQGLDTLLIKGDLGEVYVVVDEGTGVIPVYMWSPDGEGTFAPVAEKAARRRGFEIKSADVYNEIIEQALRAGL